MHDVKSHEGEPKMPWPHTHHPRVVGEVPHHPSHDHVHKCIGPERGNEDEHKPCSVVIVAGWVEDTKHTEDVGHCLNRPGHGDYPAIEFAMQNGLRDMGESR